MTPPRTPTTAAGRALLRLLAPPFDSMDGNAWAVYNDNEAAILAIEAEARAPLDEPACRSRRPRGADDMTAHYCPECGHEHLLASEARTPLDVEHGHARCYVTGCPDPYHATPAPLGVEEAIAQGQRMLAASEAAADREITRLNARVVDLNAEVLDRMDQWHRDSLARDELARQQAAEIARLRATPAPLSPIVITVCPHSVDTRFTHCLLCERAADPSPLDVERLARALHHYSGWYMDHTGPVCLACTEDAADIAREYAKEPQP